MKGVDMTKGFFSRGFLGKRREVAEAGRLSPGQYLTEDYPVLSAGPTPYMPKDRSEVVALLRLVLRLLSMILNRQVKVIGYCDFWL
jgi:hypothetical protein